MPRAKDIYVAIQIINIEMIMDIQMSLHIYSNLFGHEVWTSKWLKSVLGGPNGGKKDQIRPANKPQNGSNLFAALHQ